MNHKGTVRLETERLILRRFEMTDIDAMFKNYCSDPEVTKYLTWKTHESPEDGRLFLTEECFPKYDAPDFYQWAIELKELGEVIGGISVVKSDEKIAMLQVGYCIGRPWWRQGYTTEALKCVVKFFFEEVKANRIESFHDPRNPNSGKVMSKAGMKYEGTSRESQLSNQGLGDAAQYAVIARDYHKDI